MGVPPRELGEGVGGSSGGGGGGMIVRSGSVWG